MIPSLVKLMTSKLLFTASLFLTPCIKGDSVENKLASLLVFSLGKALQYHLGVVDRWPTTPKPTCNGALIVFSRYEDKMQLNTNAILLKSM